jgi:ribosome maturation factor RimP
MQHQSLSPKSSPGLDHDRVVSLTRVIDPVVRAHGAELVDVELKNENGWVLCVFVERLGALAERMSTKQAAIDLSVCSDIARDLSPLLDEADPIPHRYNLEVGSPGVERPLKKEADYARFHGEKAKLKLRNAQAGQKVVVGVLGALEQGVLALQADQDGRTYAIPFDDIVSGRLVFEFGPASRPGSKPGSKPGSSKNGHAPKTGLAPKTRGSTNKGGGKT